MHYCIATDHAQTLVHGRISDVLDLADRGHMVPAGTWHAMDDDGNLLCGVVLDPTYVFDSLDFRRGSHTGTRHCAACKLAIVTADMGPVPSGQT